MLIYLTLKFTLRSTAEDVYLYTQARQGGDEKRDAVVKGLVH